jgi:hypothetical protein
MQLDAYIAIEAIALKAEEELLVDVILVNNISLVDQKLKKEIDKRNLCLGIFIAQRFAYSL